MKGDFSRLTGLKAKRRHYNGVLKQQGRVQLDSDWNELISIISHQRKTRTIDTIGLCGAPIHDSGYQILHPGGALQDLLIASGRFYVGGLLCETSPSSKLPINAIAAGGDISVDDTKIDGVQLEVSQWIQIITDENSLGIIGQISSVGNGELRVNEDVSSLAGDSHPYLRRLLLFSDQPDFPQPIEYTPVGGQTDLLYLDVWERHITPIEESDLREVALGGPDTDTRSKVIAQVKVLPGVGNVDCIDEIEDWHNLIQVSNGRLTTRLVVPDDPIDPCQLGESGGFLGLENHLYRVEIHDVSGTPSFKWSRDNAAYAYGINEFFDVAGQVFKIDLQQNGKDEILKIKQQDWIEISSEETDLDVDNAGTFAQVLKVEGTILTLDTDVAAHMNETLPKIRRWDISNQRPDATTDIVADTGFQLEDGIEIEFSGSEFKIGDYWVFSARSLTGEIEILDREAPLGIVHHYCKLGLVTGLADGNVEIEDCRPEFPPLTELPESGESGKCCTYHVAPEPGWESVFDEIGIEEDAMICFEVGDYILRSPKEISRKGNLKLIGSGFGTRIISLSSESALIFNHCKSIQLRDFYIESQIVGFGTESPNYHLQGTVSIYDCATVDIDFVNFKCGHYSRRASSCLTIKSSLVDCVARVENSGFQVGYLQQGILLIDVKSATIVKNELSTHPILDEPFRQTFYRDKFFRAQVRKWLMPEATFNQSRTLDQVTLENERIIFYRPHSSVRTAWRTLLSENASVDVRSDRDLSDFIKMLTNRLFFENDFLRSNRAFNSIINSVFDYSFSSKAITVGGERAVNIRVNDNNIEGFLEGIHVGLSSNKNPDIRDRRLLTDNVNIQNNNICVFLPPFIQNTERYGIFAGNSKNLCIENNSIYLERGIDGRRTGNQVYIEGIRVWGEFGKRILVNQNIICGKSELAQNNFDVGIHVHPENEEVEFKQWLVSNNVVAAKNASAIEAPRSVELRFNVEGS